MASPGAQFLVPVIVIRLRAPLSPRARLWRLRRSALRARESARRASSRPVRAPYVARRPAGTTVHVRRRCVIGAARRHAVSRHRGMSAAGTIGGRARTGRYHIEKYLCRLIDMAKAGAVY